VATEAAQNGRTDVRADRNHTSPALRGGAMGTEPRPCAGGHPLETPSPRARSPCTAGQGCSNCWRSRSSSSPVLSYSGLPS
jgi:hypothetical protein